MPKHLDRLAQLFAATVAACVLSACGSDGASAPPTRATDGDSGPAASGGIGGTGGTNTAGAGGLTGSGGSISSGGAVGTGGTVSTGGSSGAVVDECSQPLADWIFCDSFESGQTYDGSTTTPVLVDDPGPIGLSGNHAMQLRSPAGARGGAGVWKSLPESDALYVRFYVSWELGYDPSAPHHGPGGLAADAASYLGRSDIRPAGDEYFNASMEFGASPPYPLYSYTYYRGMYQDCADPNGSCWGDSFPCSYGSSYCTNPAHLPRVTQPSYENGKWYCIEQFIDAGTAVSDGSAADGVLDFWVDGLEVGPWTQVWWRTAPTLKINTVWLYLFNHDDTHSVQGLLIDDVVVSTSRIGCRG